MSAIDDVAIAAFRKIHAQRELDEASVALASALVALRQERKGHTPKYQIGRIVRDFLSRHGFTVEMISALSISDGSVRNMLDKKRPPHDS
jgi:hypothetical protein